ncbi:MAG: bifunctional aspartate transaminase/aspartate 4-decarboxylase [Muribaculaceae bacterium]|nr:bifunctional aspartate transaminase/aspartate 4-decarboxylase [Muribaculaceae bacterium]
MIEACDTNIKSRECEKSLGELSPFELKNILINLAKEDAQKGTATFLNAGRGNPNWVTVKPRRAFFLLGQWAMDEAKRVWDDTDRGIYGEPQIKGAGARLRQFLADNKDAEGADLLQGALDYLVNRKGALEDAVAQEWASAILGDTYPTPDRILKYTEALVRDYLAKEMGHNAPCDDSYDLFATEGGTAAMCYAFNSLQANFLMNKGDKMALMTPVFTPYIEIPRLDTFGLNVVNISANAVEQNGYHDWQYPDSEIEKLRDPSVKLLCVVNPSNPPSTTLSRHTLDLLIDIVKNDNPNLMIITDDVYGTFVNNFRSLMYELPFNTMCVYSFSKYFGATGWRLAVMGLKNENVFDRLIAQLPQDKKDILNKRYSSLTLEVEKMKFVDRLVADSRLVALNHTAGLSTPQQMQMSLMAAMSLLDTNDDYKAKMQSLINDRLTALWSTTGFTLQPDPLRAGYYSEIDMMVWAKKIYGDDFAKYLNDNYEPLDVVIRLAHDTAVVLLNGDGFGGPKWSVRASLANLNKEDYLKIGTAIRNTLAEYHDEYLASQK